MCIFNTGCPKTEQWCTKYNQYYKYVSTYVIPSINVLMHTVDFPKKEYYGTLISTVELVNEKIYIACQNPGSLNNDQRTELGMAVAKSLEAMYILAQEYKKAGQVTIGEDSEATRKLTSKDLSELESIVNGMNLLKHDIISEIFKE